MDWKIFVITLLVMLIGYLIGSISTSIIVSKIIYKKDIRMLGSGNAGATNVARNYGYKMGILVSVLDFLKPVIAILIAYSIRRWWLGGSNLMIVQVAALGTIIGHIWPIFFKFKGGKGVACVAGFIVILHWLILFIFLIFMIIIAKKTRKVSLASIFCPIIAIICQIVFHFIPFLDYDWFRPIVPRNHWWISTMYLTIVTILIIFKHIPNIKKLIKHEERTIDVFKK